MDREYLPSYTTEALRRFMASCEEDFQLLHLSMRGIAKLRAMPRVVQALIDTEPQGAKLEKKDDLQSKLAVAHKEASLAERECERNFPLLHAHTLVATWGAFEAAIEDTIVNILLKEPQLLRTPAFSKVKISLGDFHASDEEGRIRFLLAEINRSQGLARKSGVDAFEFLLEFLCLSGPLEPELKKKVWEMHHVRNVLVHRAACADARLVEACPWLNLTLGQPVVVTHEALTEYGAALCDYCSAIALRLGKRYEVDTEKIVREAAAERPNGLSRPLAKTPE